MKYWWNGRRFITYCVLRIANVIRNTQYAIALGAKLLLVMVGFVLLTGPEWPAFGDSDYRLQTIVQQRGFNFAAWLVGAYGAKAEGVLAQEGLFLPEAGQRELVLGYLALIAEANRLEGEIARVYVEGGGGELAGETAVLQTTLAETRAAIAQQQTLAEAIVQSQVAAILAEEGFAVGGITWPPVMMQMTPLPSLLIVSPRERIERVDGVPLAHGLDVAVWDGMETAVLSDLNLSALVVPIGGLGTYPAMIMETSSVNWLVEVTAHEWAHHWLNLKPLGYNYLTSNELRTMNETVASLVEAEIGARVIARYYPEFVPQDVVGDEGTVGETAVASPTPPPFDFRAEMAETRIQTDELLARGEVAAAEMYMEARRRQFVANGYQIRKLNQAYFAFYGAYADQPGATGSDPIGPLLRQLRAQTPSLRAFLDTVAPITSLEELERLVER